MGNLSECDCDRRKWGQRSSKGWMWGGCSVDMSFGMEMVDKFVNGWYKIKDVIFFMDKYNNKVGRQVGGLLIFQNLII